MSTTPENQTPNQGLNQPPSQATNQSQLSKTLVRAYYWFSLSSIGLFLVILLTLAVLLGLLLFNPNTAQKALPYISSWTNGQLQIESAKGRLIDGLTLKNVHYQDDTTNLQIDTISWHWQLKDLLRNRIQIDQLTVSKAFLKTVTQPKQTTTTENPLAAIFAFSKNYSTQVHIDDLQIHQANLQIDQQPIEEIDQLKTALEWQNQQLKIADLTGQYQQIKIASAADFTLLNSNEFSANLALELTDLNTVKKGQKEATSPPFNSIKLTSKIQGNLNTVNIQLNTTLPYISRSQHTLKLQGNQIALDSHWQEFKAKLNTQWQLEQTQGHTQLQYDADAKKLTTNGQLALSFKNHPKAKINFNITAPLSALITNATLPKTSNVKPENMIFTLQSQLTDMGSLQAKGTGNLITNQFNIDVTTQHLNLQWINPENDYQITSQFNWKLNNFVQRQSQFNITQFDLTGLPENLSFIGQINTRLNPVAKSTEVTKNTLAKYKIDITNTHLNYAKYSGSVQAQLALAEDLSHGNLQQARLVLGDNQANLSGQWAKTFELKLNAKLNQLSQIYQPLSGSITLNMDTKGNVKKDLSGFYQAWSTVQLNANQLGYRLPAAKNKPSESFSIKTLNLKAQIPLHKLAQSELHLHAQKIQQKTGLHQNQLLLSALVFDRQAQPKSSGVNPQPGFTSDIKLSHPNLSLQASTYETKPSLDQQTIRLKQFDIKQPNVGDWSLKQATNIDWKSPNQIKIANLCIASQTTQNSEFCLKSDATQAEWSMHALPIFDWLEPWLTSNIKLKGQLNGQGNANWKNKLVANQSLTVPQLDVTLIEQGFVFPISVKNWQTQAKITPNTANIKSQAQLNETGHLNLQIDSQKQTNQAWLNAKIKGDITATLNEWTLNKRALEFVELHKTALKLHSQLSGKLNAPKHNTQANLDVKLDLPLLGLSDQSINLTANVTPKTIDATGLWTQTNNRHADLSVKLVDLQTQPKLLANFKTDTIELLKTQFAELNTSANIDVTLLEGATHIKGFAQLHDSSLNLDKMPLHERTSTSDDEIIIDKQGNEVPKQEMISQLSYDLKIGFGKQVKINVRDAETFLGGELQLVKQGDSPDLQALGEVKLLSGYINLDARNQIQIAKSSFSFNGAIGNPALNVNLFRVVDQTTARLNITGTATQPQFAFYSDPSTSQGRIINLLIFGRAGDSSQEPNYQSQVLSAFYKLGIQNNTPVLNTLTRTLGIEDVYFDVKDQKVSNLLVGRALTDKLYVRYAKDLTGQQNNAVQFFYQLTQKLLIKSNSADDSSSVDLIYRIER
ncbi:translocation/assembly module TamB domain-containing protein [Thiomicrorhabdus sp.]|uniref:translocation/assembly module TamB domain-containing protein n=1 Tax=Thiomicrorhabdus sp. TaxID=2039724 RepID=UPI002AA82294|nr:translocation/assembly module TamB domain-containing protein [Thiomicrorhabdus sp.]